MEVIPESLNAFENHGNALPHANAHGAQRIAAARGVQTIHGSGGQTRTRCTQWMTQGNGAAPSIDALVVVS
jgi:hypothetical protein